MDPINFVDAHRDDAKYQPNSKQKRMGVKQQWSMLMTNS